MEDKKQKLHKWEARKLIIVPVWFIASSTYYFALFYKFPNLFKLLTFNDVLYNNYLIFPLLIWCSIFLFVGFYKDNLLRILSFILLTMILFSLGGYYHYDFLAKRHLSNVLVNMLSQDNHNVLIVSALDKGLLVKRIDSDEVRLIAWNAIESIDYKIGGN